MKLNFELWLNDQTLDIETQELFYEGIKCYKANAYRSGLLFSYLGLQSMIKSRIKHSVLPNNYVESEWEVKKREILNDKEHWERKIQELVKDRNRKPIFNLSDDVYNQYFYWKDRRNDCAHAKGNEISSPHVEAFWLFVKTHSLKFVVNGGKDHIINMINDHYDISITPPNKDIGPIIDKIAMTVEERDLPELFKEIRDLSFTINNDIFYPASSKKMNIWKLLLKDNHLSKYVVGYLLNNFTLSMSLFKQEPELIRYFSEEQTYVRKLWRSFTNDSSYYKLYLNMLRFDLIPDDQLLESFDLMFETVVSDYFDDDFNWYMDTITDLDNQILNDNGFFEHFKKNAFQVEKIATKYKWGNNNKSIVNYYILNYGLDKQVVSAINKAFTATYPPRHLLNGIKLLYKKNEEIKNTHHRISDENNLTVPSALV